MRQKFEAAFARDAHTLLKPEQPDYRADFRFVYSVSRQQVVLAA
jgi:hypothetical protein